MTDQTKSRLRAPLQPVITLLKTLHVAPDAVSITGLVLSLVAAYLLSRGWFLAAGIVLVFGGLCDCIDGELARQSGRARILGAFLDSSFDRISEFAVFFGLFWFFRQSADVAALIFITFFASVMVSYVRARAEGIGIECKVGIFERPVRFVILLVGIFLPRALVFALIVILAGSLFTVVQRMVHVIRKARQKGE